MTVGLDQVLTYLAYGAIYKAFPEWDRKAFESVTLVPKERISHTLSRMTEETVKGETQLE